jgi:hypothetical protein
MDEGKPALGSDVLPPCGVGWRMVDRAITGVWPCGSGRVDTRRDDAHGGDPRTGRRPGRGSRSSALVRRVSPFLRRRPALSLRRIASLMGGDRQRPLASSSQAHGDPAARSGGLATPARFDRPWTSARTRGRLFETVRLIEDRRAWAQDEIRLSRPARAPRPVVVVLAARAAADDSSRADPWSGIPGKFAGHSRRRQVRTRPGRWTRR